jgi:hypothetical protein
MSHESEEQQGDGRGVQSGKLTLLSDNLRHGRLEKADPQSTALVPTNDATFARLVRDVAGLVEGDKVEEIVVGVRPVLRGFRYGGNIRFSNTAKCFNCDALEVYVDGQRFTLYPGSDMEVRAATTARMEVEPKGRSTASIEPILCTFYSKT